MKRIAKSRALSFSVCALLLAGSGAFARDVSASSKVSGVKHSDAEVADANHASEKKHRAKNQKAEARVERQLKQLVKKQRTRNGWLGDGTHPENVRAIKDLSYAEKGGSEAQKLDLYLPAMDAVKSESAAKRNDLGAGLPLVVWIHGGGWRGGDKKGGPFRALLDSGFAVASINYRLSGEAKWPAQLDDCRSALAYLRAHAGEYNIDVKRIGLWGGSAGGHLVLMLALKGDKPDAINGLHSSGKVDGENDLAAVCDWFGPTDLVRFSMEGETTKLGTELVQELIGLQGEAFMSACAEASPVTYVGHRKHVPPILIMHGKSDQLVAIKQSQNLVSKMNDAGIKNVRLVELNGGHGFPGFGADTILDVVKFFQEKLQK